MALVLCMLPADGLPAPRAPRPAATPGQSEIGARTADSPLPTEVPVVN